MNSTMQGEPSVWGWGEGGEVCGDGGLHTVGDTEDGAVESSRVMCTCTEPRACVTCAVAQPRWKVAMVRPEHVVPSKNLNSE